VAQPSGAKQSKASKDVSLSTRPARVTKAAILRVLRAVEDSGVPREVTILPDGAIRISPMTGGKLPSGEAKDASDVVMGRLEG